MKRFKRALVHAAITEWVRPLFSPMVRDAGTIFMLHRFADPDLGNLGHDVGALRARLADLRRSRRPLLSAEEIIGRAAEGSLKGISPVAFTVDDGYADFARVAAPVFAEFDCPVTVFLVSGVLDRRTWYWWDRITVALERTNHQRLRLEVGSRILQLAWSNPSERLRVGSILMEELKRVPNDERLRVLDEVSVALGVDLPAEPPSSYAPMTWGQVRECARRGVTFGAHTVTHPILSRVSDSQARSEIETSWKRVREETSAVTDVFCYPNGGRDDFSDREIRSLAQLGLRSAVTTIPGHITRSLCSSGADAAYRIPRFSYPENNSDFVQITSGIERAKGAFRGTG